VIRSKNRLKKRLPKWGWEKSLRGEIMTQLARTKATRKKFENKHTSFRVHKKPARDENTDCYLQRHDISGEELLEMASPINGE